MSDSEFHIGLTETYGAHNYAPLDVVIASAQGVWVYDVEGRKYLDMLSCYSALNFGHGNPRFLRAAHQQLDRLTLTSRAFHNDQIGPLLKDLTALCGMEVALIMNSGAEAVESSIKMARRWGYQIKGVPVDRAEIVALHGNFHGRTTSIISFSTSAESREGFGPFTPGFSTCAFGDIEALKAVITPQTVAVLIEPIQGEGGVIIPPGGYLRDVRALCSAHNILMIADEIQTGLCRTGQVWCCDHEQVHPDAYLVAKSLGGGIVPISALVSSSNCMQVFTPGSHGSTFGGNPFACSIAREVIRFIHDERPHERAAELGSWFVGELRALNSPLVEEVRGKGLLIGVDIRPKFGKAKLICKKLKDHGVLCKDTRDRTLRFAPPLTISRAELEWGLEHIREVLLSFPG